MTDLAKLHLSVFPQAPPEDRRAESLQDVLAQQTAAINRLHAAGLALTCTDVRDAPSLTEARDACRTLLFRAMDDIAQTLHLLDAVSDETQPDPTSRLV